MTIAAMQPYLFPYIGYFQLINSCDIFVMYSNVQYIKKGWINRNRILVNGKPHYITLPVKHDDFHKYINERYFTDDFRLQKQKMLHLIENTYAKAPNYREAIELIKNSFSFSNCCVSSFIENSIVLVCKYLGIKTKLMTSSEMHIDDVQSVQDRVIKIVKTIDADHYINAIGGINLYDKTYFDNEGVKLSFIKPRNITYKQFKHEYIPFLSIIDVMMFNDINTIKEFLLEYDLI